MSIRQYLFIAISMLIVTVAVSQLVLMQTFKNRIEIEIDERGKRFADKIIKHTLDNIEDSETFVVIADDDMTKEKHRGGKSTIQIDIQRGTSNSTYIVDAGRHINKAQYKIISAIENEPKQTQVMIHNLLAKLITEKAKVVKGADGELEVEVSRSQTPSNKALKRHFIKQMRVLSEEKLADPNKFEEIKEISVISSEVNSGAPNSMFNKMRDGRHHVLDKMFNYISFIIILTSIIALLLVFWLSKKLSDPLRQLSDGFKSLETGQKDVFVEPQGVEEVKNTIVRFNKMCVELTKLADAEKQLAEKAHLAEIGDVSKGLAHALRNPMHTLGLAVEQLQDSSLPESAKQKLFGQIDRKIKQLDKCIKALLTLTTGEVKRDQEVNINALIQDVVLELRQSVSEDKPLNVLNNVAPECFVVGELNELRTIIHTLIFNGYEASAAANKSEVNLSITGVLQEHQVLLTFEDNGNGVSPEIAENLFTPHVSDKAEGAGMGLYISKRIVSLYYDGDLTLENNANGEGAIALLSIPTKD